MSRRIPEQFDRPNPARASRRKPSGKQALPESDRRRAAAVATLMPSRVADIEPARRAVFLRIYLRRLIQLAWYLNYITQVEAAELLRTIGVHGGDRWTR